MGGYDTCNQAKGTTMPSDFIKGLRARLRIEENDKYAPIPKPTKKDMDHFEETAGFQLPQSYREFAMAFGAGDLARKFKFATPGSKDRAYDLSRFHRECRKFAVSDASLAYFPETDLPRALRMFWFSLDDIRSQYFGWDTLDLTDVKNHEYGIYILPDSKRVILRIAGSFPEFVNEFCLSRRGIAKFRGIDESEEPEPEPAFSRVTDFSNPRKDRKAAPKGGKRATVKRAAAKKATRTKKKKT